MKTALVFPGQGSQTVGMGRDFFETHPEARALFQKADEVLGIDLSRICFEGPESELRETRNTQPAIFLHSLAVLEVLRRSGIEFHGAAGHSLGEYSAYVAAGSLSFEDGLRIVRRRGELMYAAGKERPGTMAAVLGLERTALVVALAEVAGIVVPANYNSPGQIVISGEVEAVGDGMERCKSAGAKRTIPLEVSGAFHSPLMEPALPGLRDSLAAVDVAPALVPVYANASASPVTEPSEIRESLVRQLISPVRWEETIRAMRADGFERFIEVGPGKVLSGLVRACDRNAVTVAVGSIGDILTVTQGDAR